MGDDRPALDIQTPTGTSDLIPRLEALLDDFCPFAVEQLDAVTRRIHFFSREDRNHARQAIEHSLGMKGVTTASVEVADEDWAQRSQANLTAIRIGEIIVAPPWALSVASKDAVVVVIRPSMGFGTGHHASTRLCLQAIQTLTVTNCTVLDLGTGSGVLAIAAAKLGAKSVVAVEADQDAAETARENVRLNKVSNLVNVRHDDFRNAHDLIPAATVLVNISAGLVYQNAVRLARLVASGGTLIVGGFTALEEVDVRRVLQPHGGIAARFAEEEDKEAWVTLMFRPPSVA